MARARGRSALCPLTFSNCASHFRELPLFRMHTQCYMVRKIVCPLAKLLRPRRTPLAGASAHTRIALLLDTTVERGARESRLPNHALHQQLRDQTGQRASSAWGLQRFG